MKDSLRKAIRVLALLSLGLFPVAACGGSGGDEQGSPGGETSPGAQPMSDAVQDLVNRGNGAQRAGLYQEAKGLYQEAMNLAPDHPVPQFGALMAALALGDSALAESLRAKLQVSAPELVGMLNPDGSMGAVPSDPQGGMPGMPPGHPDVTGATPDTIRPDTSSTR